MLRRVLALVLVSSLVAVTAACAGDDSLTPAEKRAAAGQLNRYLRVVKPEQDIFLRVQQASLSANGAISTSGPDESWLRAAKTLRQSREAYETLALRMRDIRPPDSLEGGHDALARSLALYAGYVHGFQRALSTRREASLLDWSGRADANAERMVKLRQRWRQDVTDYARDVNVDLPVWVRAVGRPLD